MVKRALSGIVVNLLAFGLSGLGFASRPSDHATVLLGNNLGQVVYSLCLPSLLSSKKLGVKREVFGLDRFNGLTD